MKLLYIQKNGASRRSGLTNKIAIGICGITSFVGGKQSGFP